MVDAIQQVFTNPGKGKNGTQPPPTPNSHEDGKEHSASVIKQMGHLEAQANKHERLTRAIVNRYFITYLAVREQRWHYFVHLMNLSPILVCF